MEKVKNEDPLIIHTISTIQDVYIDSNGFIVVTIPDSNSEFSRYADGWPIYMGYEEWAFLVKNNFKTKSSKNTDGFITIKSKNPIYKGQHFAILNQQDTTHHTNEEIIEAVDRYSRLISWSHEDASSLKDYWEINMANTFTDSLTHLGFPSTVYKSTNEYALNDSITYKGSELATITDIDNRISSVIGLTEYHSDRINDLEKKEIEQNAIISDLINKVYEQV